MIGDLLLGVAVLEVRARDADGVLRVGDDGSESRAADESLLADSQNAKSEDLNPPPASFYSLRMPSTKAVNRSALQPRR